MTIRTSLVLASALLTMLGCGGAQHTTVAHAPHIEDPEPPLPRLPWETVRPVSPTIRSPLVAITGGTVMTATGRVIEHGIVIFENGRIRSVGAAADIAVPDGATVIDATNRFVTPGVIDTHSHMGVYPEPEVTAHDDGNEATDPVTAQVRAIDSFWPQDPALARALAAGVTTIQVLPGSANLIGGAGETMHMHLGRAATEMEFPEAPDTMKMACGENPKRVYGEQHTFPSTRMGNVAGYRIAFQQAVEYGQSWAHWQEEQQEWQSNQDAWARHQARELERIDAAASTESVRVIEGEAAASHETADDDADDPGPQPTPPERDFGMELLLGAIEGRVLVQMHCYRADEMARMIEISHEFGFRIQSFHHAVEAYKIRDLLAAEDIGISTWADWWGFKVEAFDAIPENLALLTQAGVRGIVHSDSPMLVQRLPQEAAKAMTAGRERGIEITDDQALRWITANPAWALGIDDRVGTLEEGRIADVVVWSGSPFSVYTHADLVYVDGILEHDRARDGAAPITDFEVGMEIEDPGMPAPSATPTHGGAR
jgi:imidazolonepropionase-like amidohydrolase